MSMAASARQDERKMRRDAAKLDIGDAQGGTGKQPGEMSERHVVLLSEGIEKPPDLPLRAVPTN